MRASDFVTEVFHFVGQNPSAPSRSNYYLWNVQLNNGKHYKVRASSNSTLKDFQNYFKRKWGKDMPDVEVIAAKIDRRLDEELHVDVPNEEWLQQQIDYAISKGRNRNGVPYMGKSTAYTYNAEAPVALLKSLPGMNKEQENIRRDDLRAIMKIMKETGKLPLDNSGKEYKPFINVAYNGEAWVNEGNHRIMAAAALGWDTLPIEIRYFDGGERVEHGAMYPAKIGLV